MNDKSGKIGEIVKSLTDLHSFSDVIAERSAKKIIDYFSDGRSELNRRNSLCNQKTSFFKHYYSVRSGFYNICAINFSLFLYSADSDFVDIKASFRPDLIEYTNASDTQYKKITMDIDIMCNFDNINNIKQQLSVEILRELNENVIGYINKINKESASDLYNFIKNTIQKDIKLKCIRDFNYDLPDFVRCFYLSMPQQVNNRIREIFDYVKNIKDEKNFWGIQQKVIKTKQHTDIKQIIQYDIFSKQLTQYEIQSILKKTDKKYLQNFIDTFNKLLEDNKGKFKIGKYRTITDIGTFFEYWRMRFNLAGLRANRKIMRTIPSLIELIDEQKKECLNGEFLIDCLYGDFCHEIYGEIREDSGYRTLYNAELIYKVNGNVL